MIDSRQASDHLERCLATLAQVTARHVEPIERLVLLAHDTPAAKEIVQRQGAYMEVAQHLPRGARRHRGARLTQGEILVFLDASFAVTEDWWASLYQAFVQRRADAVILTQHPHLRLPGLSRRWRRYQYERATRTDQANPGANLAVRREWFERLGGYDMHLDDTADADFALRLVQCRARLILVPDPTLKS
ncbi:glycosyltransferase family 2 protein [Halomonas shantousis]